jgi:predicted RNA-binding protein associated with RNAse of E/G family
MRRRTADRAEWGWLTARRFAAAHLAGDDFTGWVTLLHLDAVREPLWVPSDTGPVCVADRGYAWLQHFPEGAAHTLITMLDAGGRIIQWYIDICRQRGLDARGIPWYDDLYLDIVILPSGEARLLDAEELDEALRQGAITPDDAAAAWSEATRLLAAIGRGSFGLMRLCEAHRAWLLARTGG